MYPPVWAIIFLPVFNPSSWFKVNIQCVFINRVNVGCGPAEERVLLTGLHAVADIYCECCKTTLGWKYVNSFFTSTAPSFFGVLDKNRSIKTIDHRLLKIKIFNKS